MFFVYTFLFWISFRFSSTTRNRSEHVWIRWYHELVLNMKLFIIILCIFSFKEISFSRWPMTKYHVITEGKMLSISMASIFLNYFSNATPPVNWTLITVYVICIDTTLEMDKIMRRMGIWYGTSAIRNLLNCKVYAVMRSLPNAEKCAQFYFLFFWL